MSLALRHRLGCLLPSASSSRGVVLGRRRRRWVLQI
ncbi:hypothetical protein ACP70R_047105 [Stipagrostis hirtigluma subsp. patula]